MRNPDRLNDFYDGLKAIHKLSFPDLRFGQLISNFIYWYGNDIFYLEESDFMKLFIQFTGDMKNA